MTGILYVTDPGVSSTAQIDNLGKFLGFHSKVSKPCLVVVAGDYSDMTDVQEHEYFQQLVRAGLSEEDAEKRIGEEKAQPGISFYRPYQPPIPQPWYAADQLYCLYSDLFRMIESNTDVPIILNPGNHDLIRPYQNAFKDSKSGRIFNPEFKVEKLNGMNVAAIPGSQERLRFVDDRTYCWKDLSLNELLRQLTQSVEEHGQLDLLLTHMPPQAYDHESLLGFGCDRTPDWNLLPSRNMITDQGPRVGYNLTRQYVQIHNPHLVLSGHIEEARHAQDGTLRAGAIDKIGASIVVNPGGFFPNWFETSPVGALIDYQDGKVQSVSFIVGEGLSSTVRS